MHNHVLIIFCKCLCTTDCILPTKFEELTILTEFVLVNGFRFYTGGS